MIERGMVQQHGAAETWSLPRVTWASEAAEAVWPSKLRRIGSAWDEITWLSVAQGLRACCIMATRPADYAIRARQWDAHGLRVLPLYVRRDAAGYVDSAKRPAAGQPFAFEVAVGAPRSLEALKVAWAARDDERIGGLLGYPPCCRAFFGRTWVERGWIDTTWPMAAGDERQWDGAEIDVAGAPEGNVLWRWLGVRAVPHLPCRFDCGPTEDLGANLIRCGREAGHAEEMDWLREVLSWPVTWSARDGIAEVSAPVARMIVRTDRTSRRLTVRWTASARSGAS